MIRKTVSTKKKTTAKVKVAYFESVGDFVWLKEKYKKRKMDYVSEEGGETR